MTKTIVVRMLGCTMTHTKVIVLILLLFPMALMAQQTHVLEPSIMEVAYHEISGKNNDDYALRVGRSMSQYFSYHKQRDDSLSSNAQTSMIILQEMLDEANNRNDASKQRASGPDHGDYFYRNQANNTFDTYTSFMGQGYKPEFGIRKVP